MKRFIYFILSSILLTACSSQETVIDIDTPKEPITVLEDTAVINLEEDFLHLINGQSCKDIELKAMSESLTEAHKLALNIGAENNYTANDLIFIDEDIYLTARTKDDNYQWSLLKMGDRIRDITFTCKKDTYNFDVENLSLYNKTFGLIDTVTKYDSSVICMCSLSNLRNFDALYDKLNSQEDLSNYNLSYSNSKLLRAYTDDYKKIIFSTIPEDIDNYDKIEFYTLEFPQGFNTLTKNVITEFMNSIISNQTIPDKIQEIIMQPITVDEQILISAKEFKPYHSSYADNLLTYFYTFKNNDKEYYISFDFETNKDDGLYMMKYNTWDAEQFQF